jgi:hypothetical protein
VACPRTCTQGSPSPSTTILIAPTEDRRGRVHDGQAGVPYRHRRYYSCVASPRTCTPTVQKTCSFTLACPRRRPRPRRAEPRRRIDHARAQQGPDRDAPAQDDQCRSVHDGNSAADIGDIISLFVLQTAVEAGCRGSAADAGCTMSSRRRCLIHTWVHDACVSLCDHYRNLHPTHIPHSPIRFDIDPPRATRPLLL